MRQTPELSPWASSRSWQPMRWLMPSQPFLDTRVESDTDDDDGDASSASETVTLSFPAKHAGHNKIKPQELQDTAPVPPKPLLPRAMVEPALMQEHPPTDAWSRRELAFVVPSCVLARAVIANFATLNWTGRVARLNPERAGIILFLKVEPPLTSGADDAQTDLAAEATTELLPVAVQCPRCSWLTQMLLLDMQTSTAFTYLAMKYLDHPDEFSQDARVWVCGRCNAEIRQAKLAPLNAQLEARRQALLRLPDAAERLKELEPATAKAPPPQCSGSPRHAYTAGSPELAGAHTAMPANPRETSRNPGAGRVIEI